MNFIGDQQGRPELKAPNQYPNPGAGVTVIYRVAETKQKFVLFGIRNIDHLAKSTIGGAVDPDESFVDAITREYHEELFVTLRDQVMNASTFESEFPLVKTAMDEAKMRAQDLLLPPTLEASQVANAEAYFIERPNYVYLTTVVEIELTTEYLQGMLKTLNFLADALTKQRQELLTDPVFPQSLPKDPADPNTPLVDKSSRHYEVALRKHMGSNQLKQKSAQLAHISRFTEFAAFDVCTVFNFSEAVKNTDQHILLSFTDTSKTYALNKFACRDMLPFVEHARVFQDNGK